VELKNDLSITGVLHSVDQYLNIKLNNIKVANPEKYPHMLSVRNCFVRGSVVRYIQVRKLRNSVLIFFSDRRRRCLFCFPFQTAD
jgi:small nuclear ribonucleoprotein (snRNP)-like protein